MREYTLYTVHGLFTIHFRGVTKEFVKCYNRWLLFVSGATIGSLRDYNTVRRLLAIHFRGVTKEVVKCYN